jgi:hypothetical protein
LPIVALILYVEKEGRIEEEEEEEDRIEEIHKHFYVYISWFQLCCSSRSCCSC